MEQIIESYALTGNSGTADKNRGMKMMDTIQDMFQNLQRMQWADYLDIALVAFLIYKLLPLLRTPQTLRIARTVVALVLLSWVTGEMKLHTLNWMLNQILAVGLLAFVVLFQPELRRMLDHMGGVKLRSFFGVNKPVQEMEPVITQTVLACEIMSREKVGALIVFEREHKLDEYFKAGTMIDGQVSEQLLRNIFFPKASLHDGAMVIREGRVAAAGCVLPLSTSPRLSADLGTRHRAGVGLSEVSDAVVVVVSEETGAISVATGGMLKRYLTPKTLDKLLRNELCPEEKPAAKPLTGLIGKLTGKEREELHEKE